ncbi:MAG: hypothetical protein SGI89_10185 [bacterium]|nr:hypothetical protein [bacterium]
MINLSEYKLAGALLMLVLFALTSCGKKEKSDVTVLHSFSGKDGSTPKGTMLLVENELYGFTSAGGNNDKGVIFKMGIDGKNFNVLYNFETGADNGKGKEPHHASLYYFNGKLYGAALYGGKSDYGVIYSVNTDGSGYTPLHVFNGGDSDGAQPHSSISFINGAIYGMTAQGGDKGKGVLYKMDPDGNNFTVLHSFHKEDGHEPHGIVITGSNGNSLYGITKTGGTDDVGVIFTCDLNGGAYTVLHNFKKGKDDGNTSEHGYLTLSGNTLFGLTQNGGENDKGVIFSIEEDGSGFKVHHSFGAASDGKSPFGSLQLTNGFLYGTTQEGGENDRGTVFKISTDGKNYKTLASLDRPTTGEYPIDNVTINPSLGELYCFSQQGGVNDDDGKKNYGTIFKYIIDATKKH